MINNSENKLHLIFVQDIETLTKLWGDYMTKPYATEDLLDTMSYYADRWGEACANLITDNYEEME
jgi:hypothetical protein